MAIAGPRAGADTAGNPDRDGKTFIPALRFDKGRPSPA
jgi:hypothetical protein